MMRQWPGNVQTYGYCPGSDGALNCTVTVSPGSTSLVENRICGICGTYCCAGPFGVRARSSAACADRLERVRLAEHEVVLHRVRVGEDDLHELARRDGQLGLVELHLPGLHAEADDHVRRGANRRSPAACRSRVRGNRPARRVPPARPASNTTHRHCSAARRGTSTCRPAASASRRPARTSSPACRGSRRRCGCW